MNVNKMIVFLMIVSGFFSLGLKEGDGKYPVPPKTRNLLFYIQRNHNRNTIVYDANFDKSGQLNEEEPIRVYWIRYEEQGQTMELRNIEKMFAYGVKTSKIKNNDKEFKVNLAATSIRDFLLKEEAPFKATIYTIISGKQAILERLYIFADNSGFWPKVKYIELYGIDATTGKSVYEKIITDQ